MKELVIYKITGITPLLMNNPQKTMGGNNGGIGSQKKYPPEEEAEKRLYILPGGQLYITPQAFISSIIGTRGGASGRKIGKFSAATRVSGGVQIPLDLLECPLYHPETGNPTKDYTADIRRVVVQRQGIMRARPRIEKWATDLPLEVDGEFIDKAQVLELLKISGKVAGVGDYRPQCKGPFGRYTAEIGT